MAAKDTPIGFNNSGANKIPAIQLFNILEFMKPSFAPLLAAIFLLPAFTSAPADITVPAIFSDHMVLEKTANVPIWGTADPEESVSITLDGQTVKATTGADGKWKAALDLQKSGPGPFEMVIEGKNKISIDDVVVGEVWVASGQSNMDFPLANVIDADKEIANSTNTLLRQFLVTRATSDTPLPDVTGSWVAASPETSSAFTAVGYFFGKSLQKELQVPVGIIHTSWGGTPSESWTSPAALDSVPDLKAARERIWEDVKSFPERKTAFVEAFGAWIQKTKRADRPVADVTLFAAPEVSSTGWIPVNLPGRLIASGLPAAGAVWLRREVEIPAPRANKPLPLNLGSLDGYESVYWNGKLLTETTFQSLPERNWVRKGPAFTVPAALVKEGKNILALRVYEPVGPATFSKAPATGPLPLGNPWMAKAEYELPALSDTEAAAVPRPPTAPVNSPHVPGYLFNAMIHPLVPYAISGVIWYQGESNSGRAWQYRIAFPLLIADWRKQWNQKDLPFYFCQLANFTPKPPQPGESAWAELREAQSSTLKLPQTGQAILIDLGETEDIHPRNKKDVGERLAKIALAKDYGKNIPFSGPVFEAAAVEKSKIRVKFSPSTEALVATPVPANQILKSSNNTTSPLVRNSPESEIEGFAICGEDRQWVWADAKIDGDSVLVWSDKVPSPIAVRYAWANNPTGNLYNAAGLPAGPFRSDDFPATTINNKLKK